MGGFTPDLKCKLSGIVLSVKARRFVATPSREDMSGASATGRTNDTRKTVRGAVSGFLDLLPRVGVTPSSPIKHLLELP
jgi:hypothetical protein